ncbi:hypothetical protein [Shinella sp. JR1-6]|uniref:hypothetical protein n=1 Tax=Shinella sp. JR1-6 TaxID=2527671 RepID=UPI0014051481|nr:hypothetical protein [Shinella sp. JR1-6]
MRAVADLDTVQPMPLLVDGELARGRDGSRKLPVPMLPSEIVRIETAMYFAQVSDKTIRIWAHKDGIGRQAERHSPLQISLPALLMKIDGQTTTLERLRAGERNHPSVRFYLARTIAVLEAIRNERCGS